MMLLAFMMLAYTLERKITRRHGHATVTGKSSSPTVVRLGPFRWVARGIMILYLAIGSILPFGALVIVALERFWSADIKFSQMSFDNYKRFFEDELFRSALRHSLTLAVTGATIAMVIAALLVSYARFTGSEFTPRVVEGVARAPAAISHLVLAIAFLLALGGSPFKLANTVTILLLAYILMQLPQAWISAGQGIEQIGQPLLDASAISGASRFRTFRNVNLPLMGSSLSAGWAMLFVVMVGDLTASAILAGPNSAVVGNIILIIYDNGTYSNLAALGTTIAVISGTVVTVVMLLARRAGPSARALAGA
jgi:iron(III) transport system permease protein